MKRIEALETVLKALEAASATDTKSALKNNSKVMALFSFVQELAQREGVSEDDFQKHYEARCRYWYGQYLHMTEDSDAAVAAQIDDRTVREVETSEDYPSMFDPPPSDNT